MGFNCKNHFTAFNDVLKYGIAQYGHSIFPDRAAVLGHLFCTNGNGYDWENGVLAYYADGAGRFNELVQIERAIATGKHLDPLNDLEYIPEELLRELIDVRIPADINERMARTDYASWYPMSEGYNKLDCIPDDVKPDWLNAAWETCNLVIASKPRKQHHPDHDPAKEHERNVAIATKAKADMERRFPDHKFENNPLPTWDANRAFVPGVKAWPIDGSTVYFEDIVDPFVDAFQFAYNVRRKNLGKDIPYTGFDIGHGERALGPEITFSADELKRQSDDQGRNAMRMIMGMLASVSMEQGRRMAQKEISQQLHFYFMRKNTEEEIAKLRAAATDPVQVARFEIIDKLNARRNKEEETGEEDTTPLIDESDPVQVEALRQIQEAHKKMLESFNDIMGEQ